MPPRTVFLYAFVQIEGYAPVNRIETVKSDKGFDKIFSSCNFLKIRKVLL